MTRVPPPTAAQGSQPSQGTLPPPGSHPPHGSHPPQTKEEISE